MPATVHGPQLKPTMTGHCEDRFARTESSLRFAVRWMVPDLHGDLRSHMF